MAISLEKRVANLENELKALKAVCPISGSLAKMYVQKSEIISVGGSTLLHAMEVEFTPTFKTSLEYLVTLFPIVKSTYAGISWEKVPIFDVKPQTGNGKIRIKIYNLANTDKVTIIASGSSPGTFTRIS